VEDLKNFGISESFQFMRSKSEMSFKRMLKIKTKEFALNHLLILKSEHSKMDKLCYIDLKMQNYLKSSEIPVNEAQNLFKYRARVAQFKENFEDKYENKACPMCSVNLDTQVHSLLCEKVKEKVNIEGKYSDKIQNTIKHFKNSLQHFKAEERPLVKKNCLFQLWRP
jgi:hypothetical protein